MAFKTLRFKTAFLRHFPRTFPAFLINYKRVDLWRLKKPGLEPVLNPKNTIFWHL
jgi:hypothetical protein